jgi:DNA-3-methyladenine glycosylase
LPGHNPALSFLAREFFTRDTTAVARDLIGCRIRREIDGQLVVATIIEVEAYLGESDPASHAFRGPTPRSAVMFGPAGHLYVYLSYGIHRCVNVVTEKSGTAGAVLLRAARVVEGCHVVRRLRGSAVQDNDLLRGPGNLGKGLGMTLGESGKDVCGGDTGFQFLEGTQACTIRSGPRIGITRAAEAPLRFWSPDLAP